MHWPKDVLVPLVSGAWKCDTVLAAYTMMCLLLEYERSRTVNGQFRRVVLFLWAYDGWLHGTTVDDG